MSTDGLDSGTEVAWRLFSTEYNDADWSFKEGEDERSPNYVVTPTGAKVNRLFVVGVVTEVDNIGETDDLYRVRISDPTGAYMVYAGQYQPDAMSFFADLTPPAFVAVVGKARTYTPDDGDEVYTSIRPEEVNEVDSDTRDRWNLQAASQTLSRLTTLSSELGFSEPRGEEDPYGLYDVRETAEHYGLDTDYVEDLTQTAVEVIGDQSSRELDAEKAVEEFYMGGSGVTEEKFPEDEVLENEATDGFTDLSEEIDTGTEPGTDDGIELEDEEIDGTEDVETDTTQEIETDLTEEAETDTTQEIETDLTEEAETDT
ncbi:MAG: RPA family protein, partial [Halobacteria archaeon]